MRLMILVNKASMILLTKLKHKFIMINWGTYWKLWVSKHQWARRTVEDYIDRDLRARHRRIIPKWVYKGASVLTRRNPKSSVLSHSIDSTVELKPCKWMFVILAVRNHYMVNPVTLSDSGCQRKWICGLDKVISKSSIEKISPKACTRNRAK